MKIKQTKVRNIVTGVDGNYLHKLIIFYISLKNLHNNFILHVFCFDDVAYKVLRGLSFKDIKIYPVSVIETESLLKMKKNKERLYEYYWACNPFMAKYVIDNQKCDFVALADCDLMFFQSPEVIFQEFKSCDVIIQPNNFSYQYRKDVDRYGYYCTSFQCFRNNSNGRKILNYWCGKCSDWCSRKYEKNKFGDQKYLDDWRIRFKNVREISNVGTNIAPWNVQKYDFTRKDNRVLINNNWPLIYYHYHSFKMNLDNYEYIITGDRNLSYPISKDVIKYIYIPYIKISKKIIEELKINKLYSGYVKTNPHGNYHTQVVSTS